MGQIFGKKFWFSKRDVRIIMHGLDAAGKTTILYKLKLGEVVSTIPTIGMMLETVSYKNITITAWDVGGRCSVRPLFRHYYALGTDAILFVIDSNDRERLDEVKDELGRLLHEDELRDSIVLILANKQDLPNAMSVAGMAEALDFHKIRKSHRANIMGCTAVTGDGLYEALDWLSSEIHAAKSRTSNNESNSVKDTKATMISKTSSEQNQEKTPWSFTSYVKGNMEKFKALLPKLG